MDRAPWLSADVGSSKSHTSRWQPGGSLTGGGQDFTDVPNSYWVCYTPTLPKPYRHM